MRSKRVRRQSAQARPASGQDEQDEAECAGEVRRQVVDEAVGHVLVTQPAAILNAILLDEVADEVRRVQHDER